VTCAKSEWLRPPEPLTATGEIAIVGMETREARELARAARAAGIAVRPLAFGSPLAEEALAAHGPGSVSLPLAIVAGRYSLERPALSAVLECIEVLSGTRQALPRACVALTCSEDPPVQKERHEQ
jgi:hypothetical protein